ncbi:MAG: flagellar biosynthesis anti-sigma factor FlgM [Spirochaetaceae bacterium]|nr:MAG: flagellar biosynthesis anti-sigma factor FlgM [Spirochaetaceae bacterium]
MSIDRLGPVDPVAKFNKAQKAQRVDNKPQSDSVNFSDESRIQAEIYKISEEVRNQPDIRADRVAEVQRKLQDPEYINDAVLATVADRIMDVFGI